LNYDKFYGVSFNIPPNHSYTHFPLFLLLIVIRPAHQWSSTTTYRHTQTESSSFIISLKEISNKMHSSVTQ